MKRDYFYEVDVRGVVTLEGHEQDDPWFLDTLYRRLAASANPEVPDYPFVSRCGEEMNYLRPADTPIVYTSFDGRRLGYGGSLSIAFRPEELRVSEHGVLYHAAPVGLIGRCAPSVAVEIAKSIVPWGPCFAYRSDDGHEVVIESMQADDAWIVLRPRPDNHCVGCGGANPLSLRLSFLHNLDDEIVQTWITPTSTMQGAMGTVHGGLVSLLLDEVMGKALSVRTIKAPTARLEVNFRKPMRVGIRYHCWSRLEEMQGRKFRVRACIEDADGTVIAEGHGLFVSPRSDSHS